MIPRHRLHVAGRHTGHPLHLLYKIFNIKISHVRYIVVNNVNLTYLLNIWNLWPYITDFYRRKAFHHIIKSCVTVFFIEPNLRPSLDFTVMAVHETERKTLGGGGGIWFMKLR